MNLRAITECALPQTYTEIHAFLGLIGHYQQLNEHLAAEGASRKSEQVSLSEDALEAFQALKQGLHEHPHPHLCWLH